MLTDLLLAIGKLFTWSFQILPPIGDYVNWIIAIVATLLLAAWTLVLVRLGDGEDRPYVPKNKFPYF